MARQRSTSAAPRDFENEDEAGTETPVAPATEPAAVVAPAAPPIQPQAVDPLPRAPLLPGMAVKVSLSIVEAPLGDVPSEQYRPRHIDLHLDHTQADTLKQLMAGLDARGDRLANGNRVRIGSVGDAVRWLLEQLHQGRA